MIEAHELTKDYGTVVAVREVSFDVGRGEVVGFLGPNGAGKTTTLRMLAGALGPTSGRIRINGYDVSVDPLGARRSLGYMPESAPLYPEMRTLEYLTFRARLKGIAGKDQKRAVGEAAEQARVADMAHTLIGHLSKGYRQRVALADALLGRPPLLILDEPTAGLDPNQIQEVRALVRELGSAHTILLSTHILSEVEATCDRALVIHRGRLVAQGSLDELSGLASGRGATLRLRPSPETTRERVEAVLRAEPLLGAVRVAPHAAAEGEGSLVIELELGEGGDGRELERTITALVHAGFGVESATPRRAALDDVFRSLTRPEGAAAPSAGGAAPSEAARPAAKKKSTKRARREP